MTISQDLRDTTERRHQQRLWVPAPIKLIRPDKDELISATNQNISWGGALFTVAQPLAPGVDSIMIYLPWAQGQHISIRAAVLRTTPLPDGQYCVAVRFSSITPKNQSRLEKLLKFLKASDHSADHEEAAELFQELAFMIDDAKEFRQILAQIADGRCVLQEFKSYDNKQSIALSLEGPGNLPAIRLRARVIDTQKATDSAGDWSNLHLVTLGFEHPRQSLTSLIQSLLERLPKVPGA